MNDFWTISSHAIATLPVPMWECLFGRNDSSLKEITFWVWVLRCNDQIAIIDTGLPGGRDLVDLDMANQAVDSSCVFSPLKTIEDVLIEEQITEADVDFVLLTQLVTYCTGGMQPGRFPNAKTFCAWGGMEELLTDCPKHPPKPFYFTRSGWMMIYELLMDDRVVFAKERVSPASGLIFEPTGGHHPGSAGVKICTPKGWVGILETAFIKENIEGEIPIGIAENAALCRKIIRSYRSECALAIAGHEPAAAQMIRAFLAKE